MALYNVSSRLKQLRTFLESNPDEEFFVSNRAIPIGRKRFRNIIVVAKRTLKKGEDTVFDTTWDSYKNGDDEYKNSRMKFIPGLDNAPWLLRKSVEILGGQRPVIMGKGYLKQKHFMGPNFTEVDVDISSSAIARKIAGQVLPYAASLGLMILEGFVIEGKTEEECPERILEQHQFYAIDTDEDSAELDADDYAIEEGGEEWEGK